MTLLRLRMSLHHAPRSLTLFLGLAAATASVAFDPEIGTVISAFPIVQAGGHPLDWSPGRESYRILIVGATWCPPCQELKASLPNKLARLRQLGIAVSTIVVESDEFGAALAGKVRATPGLNRWGYTDAIPDPARLDLRKESPRGVRDWGVFRAYGYPTTILLDNRNTVIERYRGGKNSQQVFNDVVAMAKRTGMSATVPIELPATATAPHEAPMVAPVSAVPKPAARDRRVDQAGDELIGLWKINNPEAKDPKPLFLRVIGVSVTGTESPQLEASLSARLTKWMPIEARCESASPNCVLHLTTRSGGELTANRQADGSYVGTITHMGRNRPVVRPITIEPMSVDDAEL